MAKAKYQRSTQHTQTRRTYYSWRNMIARCYNSRDSFFQHYGGRGIVVCDRWRHSYANFLADMGERPPSGHSLDRIDNNGNYEPDNCRWATQSDQSRNNRNTVILTHDGKTQCLKAWADELGIRAGTIGMRLKAGWSVDLALSTPALPNKAGLAQRKVRMLTHDGKTQCLTHWARELGVVPSAICNRLRAGWSVERALTTPARARR